MQPPASIVAVAERVLARTWGTPVRLQWRTAVVPSGEAGSQPAHTARTGGAARVPSQPRHRSERLGGPVPGRAGGEVFPGGFKSIVLRCAVETEAPDAPATCVVKRVRADRGIRYDPESPDPKNPARLLLDDWAALQFLDSLSLDPPLPPRFYGGDRATGLFVMEDLGADEGASTHELLHGNDPDRTEQVYRAELAGGCPEAAADARFHRAMAEAGAHWHVFHVIHRLPDALKGDRQRGPSSLRQQMIAWLEAFAHLAEQFGPMPALGRSARTMRERLRALWPAEVQDLPMYPAFRIEDERQGD